MCAFSYIHRVLLANLLTLYYSMQMLLMFAMVYIKNPFSSPWVQKLKLEPPARLRDPKYGAHQYIKVNNIKLHYVESGDSSKPLMLFLHGFPEFWYSWRHQIVEFQKDYWCIAVDMRGYGDSERAEDVSSYKIEILIEDVRDLVRQLGREKCILISHDWGGLIACRFRDQYPEVVSALIMLASISSTAWCREIWDNPSQRKKSWYVFLYRAPTIPELTVSINDLAIFDKVMLFPNNPSTDEADIECYKYWFRKTCDGEDDFIFQQNSLPDFIEHHNEFGSKENSNNSKVALTPPINYYRANFRFDYPEIEEHKESVPMLVAHAANDPFISHSMLDTMKKEYTCIETTIVEDCGHFLQQESPEKVNRLIRDFLAKHNI